MRSKSGLAIDRARRLFINFNADRITNMRNALIIGLLSTIFTATSCSTDSIVQFSPKGPLIVSESGTSVAMTVQLRPNTIAEGDELTIQLTSTNTNEVSVSAETFVFTKATETTPQAFSVTGVNDNKADGDKEVEIQYATTLKRGASTTVTQYSPLLVTNTDNDTGGATAGVTISASHLQVFEANSATFTVVLDAQPTGDVTIPLSIGTSISSISATSLTFTPSNYNSPQTVTLQVNTDHDNAFYSETDNVTFGAISSSDTEYSSIILAPISCTIIFT